MEIVRCEKGHFYDADLYSSCPQCEAARQGGVESYGATEPVDGMRGGAGIPPTEPVGGMRGGAGIPPTEPVGGMGGAAGIPPTEPVTRPGFTPTDFGPNMSYSNIKMQGYEPTTPVYANGISGFNPVTGWLVCVDGPDKGTDYRIHNGYNYIGRAQSMDICIQNDNHISNQNAAVIGYDDVERLFSFGPAGGHNTVRVNGKMVINAVELKAYDELTVGTTKLMFVPLCGERFDWNANK